MEAIRDLGFLDQDPVEVKGGRVAPRDVAVATMGPRLTKPGGHDLVAMRVTVRGTKAGKSKEVGWELVDYYDEEHGISAMMRATGYSLSIIGQMQARGEIELKGVHTPDECVPAAKYIEELRRRGVKIREIPH
jgi:lysine 6-dehydrogenase